ncbi:transcriptional repressor [Proteiniborus sp. MB09-C3]|uniref:Fur family transcriptional regulator n=1 Tax=Proteiniborus sp. MB09-C3 TaxID=3050072 RepID=UPI002556D0A9|nr:transcriptional repressor [Proteiniborus sp. MB09-C3]WIV13734.1 transcriptional repressor [Proteiniborus sp. MB09-C3]
MKTAFEDLSIKLKNKNIRLSHQRLKVLEYVANHRCHPTVDQIYSDLHKEIPTLSKTTVYNTLNTLIEAGLVKLITIEDNETRYDIVTENHGHFKCESCRTIYDFEINIDSFNSKDLNGFRIDNKDVYFKGICPKCTNQNN